MEFRPKLDPTADAPLYRQLFEQIAAEIQSGRMGRGERLPATRELAGQLGLNRTTVSAAYELLESEGLISGQVGRGSFVTGGAPGVMDWSGLLSPPSPSREVWARDTISFAVSRPSRDLFPLDEFRASAHAVLARRDLADHVLARFDADEAPEVGRMIATRPSVATALTSPRAAVTCSVVIVSPSRTS
jgi:2-aminoadipate transaminase